MTDPTRISDDQHNNAPAVPQGWKLVPVEPTDAMSIAGGIAWESSTADDVIGPIEDAWAAMLAASPEQNQAQPAQCVPEGRRLFDESMGESLQAEAMALFDKAEHGHVKCPAYFLHELAFTIGRLRAALAATPAHAPAQEPVTTAEVSARYRFLMALLIDRGVLTDRRYSNGTWSLQGIALVDDSGLRGAGRTPEEAIDNAIEMARLNPNDRRTKWRETHEQIAQEVGLTDHIPLLEEVASSLEDYKNDAPWGSWDRERLERLYAVIAALRAKGGK